MPELLCAGEGAEGEGAEAFTLQCMQESTLRGHGRELWGGIEVTAHHHVLLITAKQSRILWESNSWPSKVLEEHGPIDM